MTPSPSALSPETHRLKDYLTEGGIVFDVPTASKKTVFEFLLRHGVKIKRIKPSQREPFTAALLKREKMGTTGLGGGIAVPHAEVEGLKKPLVLLGVSRAGIPFEALDGEPVSLLLLVLLPAGDKAIRLALISQFCRVAKDRFIMETLRQAKNARELNTILRNELPVN